jgi:hypothetical protein
MQKTRTGQIRKRRLAVAAIFALSVAVTAPLLAPSAGAVIANPGKLDVAMTLTISTPTFTLAGLRTDTLAQATLAKNGVIKIPKSSLAFDPVVVNIDLPQPPPSDPNAPTEPAPTTATVHAVATSNFQGGLDPGTGAAFIVGNIQEVWTQTGTLSSCVVGPFRVTARTNAQGGRGYQLKTGTVSMVDPAFTLDAVPVSAPGCGGLEGSLNGALGLPVTTTTTTTKPGASTTTTTFPADAKPPVPSVVVTLAFTDAPQAVPTPPVKQPHGPAKHTPTTTAPSTPAPNVVNPHTPSGSNTVHHSRSHRSSSSGDTSSVTRTRRRIGSGWSTSPSPRATIHPSKVKAAHHRATSANVTPKAKAAPNAAAKPAAQSLTFTNAAFIKRPQSALATGLDLVGLLGLLGFSTLALWLVTTELSEFSASSRRLRTHRIAGINK